MKFALWALIVVIAACGTTNPDGSPTTADPATSSIGTTADTNPNVAIQTAGAGSCSTTPAQPAPYSLTAVTEQALLVAPLTGMHGHAAAWGDVDGDGFPDLYVGTFADRPDQAYAVRGARGPSPDRLLVGDGKSFSDNRTLDAPLGRSSGAAFADLDNDGDLDLVASRNADDAEGPRGLPPKCSATTKAPSKLWMPDSMHRSGAAASVFSTTTAMDCSTSTSRGPLSGRVLTVVSQYG